MCGRFAFFDNTNFKIKDNFIPNYNISPGSKVYALIENSKVIKINWSLSTSWSSKIKIFNARSETLDNKFSFKNKKRCVFFANGYFEWKKEKYKKIPYYHTFENKIMFLGGIFDSSGACIVTRPSYPKLAEVHHRQPVILNYNTLSDWFKKSHDYNCSFSEDIIIFPVSIKVNSSLNNCKDNVSKVE